MTLDSQTQKEVLIKLIQLSPIGGNMEQARQTVIALDKLLGEVRSGEVRELNEPKKEGKNGQSRDAKSAGKPGPAVQQSK